MKTAKVQAPSPLSSSSPREVEVEETSSVIPPDDPVPAPPRAPYEDLIIEAAKIGRSFTPVRESKLEAVVEKPT